MTKRAYVAATRADLLRGAVFRVMGNKVVDHDIPVGTLVELWQDDGSASPRFKRIDGERTQYISLRDLKVERAGSGEILPAKGSGATVKYCSRSDGYVFKLNLCGNGHYYVEAGCRWFPIETAWKHWVRARDKTPLGEETFDILVMFEHHIERRAKARGRIW